MSGAEVARQLLGHLGGLALVFVIAVGGVLAVMTAGRGRPAYWLAAAGSGLLVFGILLGPGFLPSAVTTTAIGAGVALAIFAVALDLLLGPAQSPPSRLPDETMDHRFE